MKNIIWLFVFATISVVANLNGQDRDWVNLRRYASGNVEVISAHPTSTGYDVMESLVQKTIKQSLRK